MMPEFEVSTFTRAFDWDELLAKLPADASLRGSFIEDILDELRALGFTPPPELRPRYLAFRAYPMVDYVVAMRAACALIHPRRPVREVMKAYGKQNYPRFAATLIGKTIFAAAGDFDHVVKVANKAYEVVVPGCSAKISDQRAGFAVVELRRCWAINDPVQIGTWEGAMEVANVRGQVRIRRYSLCDADFELTWS